MPPSLPLPLNGPGCDRQSLTRSGALARNEALRPDIITIDGGSTDFGRFGADGDLHSALWAPRPGEMAP
ncbi:hypothetical protein [Pseudotabrizicola alkalilacus]|uniref:hypothetical protein n=1 Tax=Pseudotabrizicola alkalilacus TaxID=2305252 RepID=UPI0011C13CFC|nr:hypothetical protein [Pseudotabrizicola alkalilacus]